MGISEFRENNTSLNPVAEKFAVPRTTLQYWLHKNFPAPGLQNKGYFKCAFMHYLQNQLHEHAVTLQKIFNGMAGTNMRKLAFDFA
jgi:hypothetical protein